MGYEFSWATISSGDDSSKCKLNKYPVFKDENQWKNNYLTDIIIFYTKILLFRPIFFTLKFYFFIPIFLHQKFCFFTPNFKISKKIFWKKLGVKKTKQK